MQLKNRFRNEDKIRYWVDHPFCAWQSRPGAPICKRNTGCALHHIDGTTSSSIFNGIMLCDQHHRIADGINSGGAEGAIMRHLMRMYTYNRIVREGIILRPVDVQYLQAHKLPLP